MDKARCNFVMPLEDYRHFKEYLKQKTSLDVSKAVRTIIYFVMGLPDNEVQTFFSLGEDAEIVLRQKWFNEKKQLSDRVILMEKTIEGAIRRKLIAEDFKKKIMEPGSLWKLEACFEILETFRQNRISEIEAKQELVSVTEK
ncbi:hypothetical protein ES708_28290 [subsurface metagenome]